MYIVHYLYVYIFTCSVHEYHKKQMRKRRDETAPQIEIFKRASLGRTMEVEVGRILERSKFFFPNLSQARSSRQRKRDLTHQPIRPVLGAFAPGQERYAEFTAVGVTAGPKSKPP